MSMFVNFFYNSESSKVPSKRKTNKKSQSKEGSDLSKLDENAKEVAIRFKNGCECHDQNCFKGNISQSPLRIFIRIFLDLNFLFLDFGRIILHNHLNVTVIHKL